MRNWKNWISYIAQIEVQEDPARNHQVSIRYGEMIYGEEGMIKRWEEYIGRELDKDERETLPNIYEVKDEFNRIDEKEVREIINELPKGKAAGED